MSEHLCDKAEDIAVIKKTVLSLEKTINGNGRRGLREDMVVLQETAIHQGKSIEEMRIVVSGLTKFVAERTGAERRGFTLFQKVIAICTVAAAFGGLILNFLK